MALECWADWLVLRKDDWEGGLRGREDQIGIFWGAVSRKKESERASDKQANKEVTDGLSSPAK